MSEKRRWRHQCLCKSKCKSIAASRCLESCQGSTQYSKVWSLQLQHFTQSWNTWVEARKGKSVVITDIDTMIYFFLCFKMKCLRRFNICLNFYICYSQRMLNIYVKTSKPFQDTGRPVNEPQFSVSTNNTKRLPLITRLKQYWFFYKNHWNTWWGFENIFFPSTKALTFAYSSD